MCLALAAPAVALANPIAVNIESDTVADDGHCSLREAVTSANLDAASGATPGECAAGSGADVLTLGPGTYVLDKPGNIENNNVTGDLDLGGDMTIQGSGAATTTIYASKVDRALDIPSPHTISIDGVTIAGGRAANGLNGAAGQPGTVGGGGGGIRNTGGTLSLTNVVVRDNAAGDGGNGGAGKTAGSPGGAGGGISSTGPLTLSNTLVDNNTAGAGGAGGLENNANPADGGDGGVGGAGGGISASGPLNITASTLRDNSAGDGGRGGDGIGVFGGLSSDGGDGRGGDAGGGGRGGGVSASGATVIQSSTIDGNRAGTGGLGGTGSGGDATGGNPGFRGGDASGGHGGVGGAGGGLAANAPAIVNVTFDRNSAGTGGTGGLSVGGDAGDAVSNGNNGGHGGAADQGIGGDGGAGGGVWASGTSHVTHATVSANRAGGAGPGTRGIVGAGGKGKGGGLNGASGDNTSGNPGAPGLGGGAFNPIGASLTLSNTAFFNNSPGPCGATVTDGGHNITFPFGCPGPVADPQLGALAANGGPVETRAPAATSPAVDAVPSSGAGCPATDARGISRPRGAGCEIGAYEVAPAAAQTGGATGITTTGADVSGAVTLNGHATKFHFDYGTTTAYGGRTPDADAAPNVTAKLAGLAPNTVYHYRLVATNGDGTGVGGDATFTTASVNPGPGPDVTKPLITAASVKPARAKNGKTTFRYTLSESANVVFTIQRALPGRKVAGKCRKPTAANRKKPKCTRFTLAGRFAQASLLGKNTRAFKGKPGGKQLKPGSYRATLVAADAAGNHSLPKRLGFKVVR